VPPEFPVDRASRRSSLEARIPRRRKRSGGAPEGERRKDMRRYFILAAVSLVAFWTQVSRASAVSLSMGNSVASPNASDVNLSTTQTDIDLLSPANATGTVDTATFHWSAGCLNAVKIKFFRRSGDTLTMTAERGPFNTAFSNTVALSPSVSVQEGDLIGI